MWQFKQSTGELINSFGTVVATGYAGGDQGKAPNGVNNPALQSEHNVGPLPRGMYAINAPRDTAHLGPFAMPLVASPENEMFGRFGFFIHGDTPALNRSASDGCIILSREIRQEIWASNDHLLQVIE